VHLIFEVIQYSFSLYGLYAGNSFQEGRFLFNPLSSFNRFYCTVIQVTVSICFSYKKIICKTFIQIQKQFHVRRWLHGLEQPASCVCSWVQTLDSITVSYIYILLSWMQHVSSYVSSYYDMFLPYMTIIRHMWVLLKLFHCMLYFVSHVYIWC
jgi:hypothetical protein